MRLEITRRADLAVRAMTVLGAADGRVKAGDLAAQLHTTAGFVPQVLGPLVRAGWVRSEPGPAGGYRSMVPLDALSVLEVIEAVDGPTDSGRCVVSDRPCDDDHPCALHAAWTRARTELIRTLAGTSVAALTAEAA